MYYKPHHQNREMIIILGVLTILTLLFITIKPLPELTGRSIEGYDCECLGIRYVTLESNYSFTNGTGYVVTAEVFKGGGTNPTQLIDSETITFASLPQGFFDNSPGNKYGNLIIERINSTTISIRFNNTTGDKLQSDNTFRITINSTIVSLGTKHLSCSEPIDIEETFGDFKITDIDKILSGYDCMLGTITLLNPPNNSIDTDGNIEFEYKVYDANQRISSCILIINNSIYKTDHSIQESVAQKFNQTLTDGTYLWGVNCTTSNNYRIASILRTLKVEIDAHKPPSVTSLLPITGSLHNMSGVPIGAVVTSPFGVHTVYADITLPNMTVKRLFLSNIGGNSYFAEFKDLLYIGVYNITFFANDTRSNINSTESTYFTRVVPPTQIFDVIKAASGNYVDYTYSILNNASGKMNLSLTPKSDIIRKIDVMNYDETSTYSVIKLEDATNDTQVFDKSYLIDLSEANITGSNITVTARGYHVFKCTEVNLTSLKCLDDEEYVQIMTGLEIGKNYTIFLNQTDPAFAETIQGPLNTSDAYIRQYYPNNNYGGFTRITVGKNSGATDAYRGIIWFNTSYISPGTEIEYANLSLYFHDIPGVDTPGNRTHGVHRIQQSPPRKWEEVQVTWNNYNSTNAWTTPGGDFNATPTSTRSFNVSSDESWISFNVTGDVRSFVNNASTNFGWIIKDQNETTTSTRRYYYSTEYGLTDYHPKLEIVYDLTRPVVRLVSPANGSTDIDGYITFEYNVTDKSPINRSILVINGTVVETDYSVTRNITQNFTYMFYNNGLYEWYVNTTDIYNNTGTSQRWLLYIDIPSAIPNVTLLYPPNNSIISNNNLSFRFRVTDDEYTQNCSLYIDDILNQTLYPVYNNTERTFNLSNISIGQHSWKVSCTDPANVTGWSKTWLFTTRVNRTSCCCGLDISTTPDVVNQGEKVLVTADVSNFFSGEAALPSEILSINTTIFRVENATKFTIVNNSAMTYISDGLWYYEFFVDNNASGTYIASVVMLTNQDPPFKKEASDAFTVGARSAGLSVLGVSPDLVNINKTVRLAAELKFNGIAVDASLVTNPNLVVQKINGTVQNYTPNIDDGIIYVDGAFNETGVYYLDWSATYLGLERAAREIVVVVGWEELLVDINYTVNTELVDLIRETRTYLLELLTDMEYMQRFTEEEIFLITDSVNSMTKVVGFLENGEMTNEEAEQQFNAIREELMYRLGDKITGLPTAETGKIEGTAASSVAFKNVADAFKDWRIVMFIVLLLMFATLILVVLLLTRIMQVGFLNRAPPKTKIPDSHQSVLVKPSSQSITDAGGHRKRNYEILLEQLKNRFAKTGEKEQKDIKLLPEKEKLKPKSDDISKQTSEKEETIPKDDEIEEIKLPRVKPPKLTDIEKQEPEAEKQEKKKEEKNKKSKQKTIPKKNTEQKPEEKNDYDSQIDDLRKKLKEISKK